MCVYMYDVFTQRDNGKGSYQVNNNWFNLSYMCEKF